MDTMGVIGGNPPSLVVSKQGNISYEKEFAHRRR